MLFVVLDEREDGYMDLKLLTSDGCEFPFEYLFDDIREVVEFHEALGKTIQEHQTERIAALEDEIESLELELAEEDDA